MRNLREAIGWRIERNLIPHLPVTSSDTSFLTQRTCLISQPMRSGGTLLTRLLDGHPALNVRPYHLLAARLSKRLDGHLWIDDRELNRVCRSVPDLWREYVYEAHIRRFASTGYGKRQEARHARANGEKLDPFLIDIDAQRYYAGFRAALTEMDGDRPPFRTEIVIAAAFAGFFGAWRNCRTGGRRKQWNVAHAVRHATSRNFAASCDLFFRSMPQGKLITIVRDPLGWAASYRKYTKVADIADVIAFYEHYLDDLDQVIDAADPSRYLVISFTNLIENPAETLKRVAEFLDVRFLKSMTTPTHNAALNTTANTVFPDQVAMGGIDKSVLSRETMLTTTEARIVRERLQSPYLTILERLDAREASPN